MADINLTVGGGAKFATFNLKDNVTGNYITATYSNLVIINSNPEFASAVPNPSNPESSVKVDDIAAGSGTITFNIHVDYIDAGDNLPKSEDKSITKTFEVVGAPHGANLELIFP